MLSQNNSYSGTSIFQWLEQTTSTFYLHLGRAEGDGGWEYSRPGSHIKCRNVWPHWGLTWGVWQSVAWLHWKQIYTSVMCSPLLQTTITQFHSHVETSWSSCDGKLWRKHRPNLTTVSWDREDLIFGFLRFSTVNKCPHLLRSDHRELI